ncbi:hypothetical protein CCACVL1_25964, partial [Corchorus capsularis]
MIRATWVFECGISQSGNSVAVRLVKPVGWGSILGEYCRGGQPRKPQFKAKMASSAAETSQNQNPSKPKTIDSHLHIWASPQEAVEYPYFPGQEPTLPGHLDFLLQ